jgi:hypothetical protein
MTRSTPSRPAKADLEPAGRGVFHDRSLQQRHLADTNAERTAAVRSFPP